MDGKRATSAVQPRQQDAYKTPTASKPPRKAATVSAAAVFKRAKLDTPQDRPSAHSLQKSTTKTAKKKKKEEIVHPLALAFKETSQEYRRHLYSTAMTKINKDLDSLLSRLHESNLQIASSDAAEDGSQVSPMKLTLSTKYQRMEQKICRPLSGYSYRLSTTTASGVSGQDVQTTLHERFQAFEAYVQEETKQVRALQHQWEGVVAEIFQLGVACLGETEIAALLSTANADPNASSPSAKDGSALFMPEQEGSAEQAATKRKRVSFARPEMETLFPGFLLQPPAHGKSVPVAPDLSLEQVQRFKDEISNLGGQHVAELQKVEEGHRAWWERKQKYLAQSLMQD